jgi:tetratricopeptide (TPR) repeat protein
MVEPPTLIDEPELSRPEFAGLDEDSSSEETAAECYEDAAITDVSERPEEVLREFMGESPLPAPLPDLAGESDYDELPTRVRVDGDVPVHSEELPTLVRPKGNLGDSDDLPTNVAGDDSLMERPTLEWEAAKKAGELPGASQWEPLDAVGGDRRAVATALDTVAGEDEPGSSEEKTAIVEEKAIVAEPERDDEPGSSDEKTMVVDDEALASEQEGGDSSSGQIGDAETALERPHHSSREGIPSLHPGGPPAGSVPPPSPPPVQEPTFVRRAKTQVFGETEGRQQYVAVLAERLRTAVTTGGTADAEQSAEGNASHREMDSRPFEHSLERNPKDRAAVGALRRIYAAQGRWQELAQLLLDQAEGTNRRNQRAGLLNEVAMLLLEHLQSPDQAFVALLQAVAVDPSHEASVQALFRLASAQQYWPELFAELGEVAMQEEDPEQRAVLASRLGDWYLHLGHAKYARACYDHALAGRADHERALVGLAAVLTHEGLLDDALALLPRLPDSPSEELTTDLLLKLARVHHELGRDGQAASFVETLLDRRPDSSSGLAVLEEVYGRQERWPELVARLRIAAQRAYEKERSPQLTAAWWRQAAYIMVEHVDDREGLETACRNVLELSGPDGPILDILADLYAQQTRWPEVVWAYEKQLLLALDTPTQIQLMLQLARIYANELDQLDQATEYVRSALELAPDNDEAHDELVALFTAQERWADVAAAIEARGRLEKESSALSQRLIEAARIRADRLGQFAEAAALLRRARALAPHDAQTVALLAETLSEAGRTDEALTYFEEHAQLHIAPQERVASLAGGAKLAMEALSDGPRALALAEQAVALDPTRSAAYVALAQTHVLLGNPDAALETLEAALARVEGEGRGDLLVVMAELHHRELRQPKRALKWYQLALESLGARRDVVLPLLELYQQRERFADAHRLALQLNVAHDEGEPTETAHLAMRCAEACLRVGDDTGAVSHLETVIRAVPGHAEALFLLADAYEESERWDDARRVLVAALATGKGGGAGRSLQLRLARVARLAGQLEEARQLVQGVLDVHPRQHDALQELMELEEAAGNYSAALSAWELVDKSVEAGGPEQCRRLLRLAQEQGDSVGVERALEALATRCPHDASVLRSLAELYEEQGAWRDAIGNWGRLAELSGESALDRGRAAFRAGFLCGDKLGDFGRAADWFERGLSFGWPTDAEVEALEAWLEPISEAGLFFRLFGKLYELALTAAPPAMAQRVANALAEGHRQAGDVDQAAAVLAEAARLDRTNSGLHIRLMELYQELGDGIRAVAVGRKLQQYHRDDKALWSRVRQLYLMEDQADAAFYLAAALKGAGKAEQEDLVCYDTYRQRTWPSFVSSLRPGDWSELLSHEDENFFVSEVFEAARPVLLALPATMTGREQEGDPEGTGLAAQSPQGASVQRRVAMVAGVLGFTEVPVVCLDESASMLDSRPSVPPGLVVTTEFTRLPEKEQLFHVARSLALHGGGRFACLYYRDPGRLAVVWAAIVASVTGDEQSLPAEARSMIGPLCVELQRHGPVLERLTAVISPSLSRGETVDVEGWWRGCELTARRTGLLFAPYPEIVTRAASDLPEQPVAPGDLDDLWEFLASSEYLELRRALASSRDG